MELVGFLEHLEHLEAGADDHRREGVGEEVRAGTLAEEVDDLLAAGRESADGTAEGFAEGAREDVDAAVAVELLGDSVARLADDTGAVAFVDHHEGVILLGEIADLVHRGDVAVHGEDAVGGDDAETAAPGFLQLGFEIGHVSVGIAEALGLAEADTVDDGGVVQRVGDDGVIGTEQRLEDTAVGIEAGGIEDGVVGMEVLRDGLFQFAVTVLGAADEADGGHAVATFVHGLLRGFDQARIVGQAEVVVGAEVEGLAAVLEGDFSALGGDDIAFVLVETGLLDFGEGVLEVLLEFSVHGSYCFLCLLSFQLSNLPFF